MPVLSGEAAALLVRLGFYQDRECLGATEGLFCRTIVGSPVETGERSGLDDLASSLLLKALVSDP